jgi:hypothetical protein
MPQAVQDTLYIIGGVALIAVALVARVWMRRAVYAKMNQPGKQKSALQKFFGW